MPWVRLDDHFDQNPKIAQVGPLGIALWVAGLAYCNRNLTDGFIPWSVARTLVSWDWLDISEPANAEGQYKIVTASRTCGMVGNEIDSDYVITLLVLAGLWDQVEGGYQIHDYGDFQPTKAQVEADRLAKQAAGQAGGQASAIARAAAGRKRKVKQPSSKMQARAEAQSNPVPDPVPVPLNSAAAGTHARETSPHWQRAIDAWERQSPGSYNPTIGDALSGWLLDGTPIDWIEKACEAAGRENGRKGVNYVARIIKRYRGQGSTEDSWQGGSNGRRTDDAGAGARGRPVRSGHGPGVGASQRVPGADVDWDAVAAEYGGNPQQADGDVAGPAAGDLGEDV